LARAVLGHDGQHFAKQAALVKTLREQQART
jgi:hypothetical protein